MSFCRDERGVALVLFAIIAPVVIVIAGGAVDYARSLQAREKLQSAADAAALALVGRAIGTPAETEAAGLAFVAAQYPAEYWRRNTLVESKITATTAAASVTLAYDVPNTFLGIIGLRSFRVRVHAGAEPVLRDLEVALVVDNSTSMATRCDPEGPKCAGGFVDECEASGTGDRAECRALVPATWITRMAAARSAIDALLDELHTGKSQTRSVRIGVVPFASTVNVGTDQKRAWLDTAGESPQQDPLPVGELQNELGEHALTYHKAVKDSDWLGCVRARLEPDDATDAPATPTGERMWVPHFVPADGGRIEEVDGEPKRRGAENRYLVDTLGIALKQSDYVGKETDILHLDAPHAFAARGPNLNCVPTPILDLTEDRPTITAHVAQMRAYGATVIAQGVAWGWRVLSPGAPYTTAEAYDAQQRRKALVLLTDGGNQTRKGSAYGGLGSPSNSYLDARLAAVCTNAKAAGITIYAVTFSSDHTEAQIATAAACASPRACGNEEPCAFHAPSAAELAETFRDIGRQLRGVRLAR